jgi:hypothetical protein
MKNNPIVDFIKTAGAIKLTAKQIRPMLKEALGQDVPEDQIQNVLAGAGGPPPGAGAPPPGGPQGSMQSSPMGGPGGPPPGAAPDPSAGAPDAQAMLAALSGGGGAPGGMPGGMPGGQADGSLIDPHELQALQQAHPTVDPTEIQQIAEELAQYLATQDAGGAGAGGPPPSPETGDAGGGADALDTSAQSGPEGAAGGAMPKQGSLNEHKGLRMIKSSPYIEGFLKRAMQTGYFDLPSAINFYGDALNNTIEQVKYAQELEEISKSNAISDKTAAYCQGIVEEAERKGLNFDQTVTLLKQSGVYEKLLAGMQSK